MVHPCPYSTAEISEAVHYTSAAKWNCQANGGENQILMIFRIEFWKMWFDHGAYLKADDAKDAAEYQKVQTDDEKVDMAVQEAILISMIEAVNDRIQIECHISQQSENGGDLKLALLSLSILQQLLHVTAVLGIA